MASNTYSPTWFELFLGSIPPQQTEAECAFLARHLPLPAYRTVLDLCCGRGRHAAVLARRGYQVTGLDRDPAAIARARQHTSGVTYRVLDMRDLASLPDSYDAIINLWQSFGYFDAETNARVLRDVSGRLTPRGRVILDVYHRDFFEQRQGTQRLEHDGQRVTERKQMMGDRLSVTLEYGDSGDSDTFNWQLYTPEALIAQADQCALTYLVACTEFDERRPPSAREPRMQLVFERRADLQE